VRTVRNREAVIQLEAAFDPRDKSDSEEEVKVGEDLDTTRISQSLSKI